MDRTKANPSKAAEDASTDERGASVAEQIKVEIGRDLAAYNAYVEKPGAPAELIQANYSGAADQ